MKTSEVQTITRIQLDEENLQALRFVVGRPVLELYAPLLNVCRLWYGGPSFSIPLKGHQCLVVESEWQETPRQFLNYFILRVALADHPKDVPESERGGRRIIGHPVSTVEIGEPKSPVVSVQILEHEERGALECAQYDAGLVFNLEDGRRFALAARQSILGGLECSTDQRAIAELMSEWKVRTVVE